MRAGTPFTPKDLGFVETPTGPSLTDEPSWSKRCGGDDVSFRRLRSLAELGPVEELQRVVFAGITDLDLVAAGMLVAVPETGGEVLGAFVRGPGGEKLVGFVIGWGGYVHGRPRVLSDMLGVLPDYRGAGLGAELKKLQAAIALVAGFVEIVWTVDPLRAANARLNFEKLGAHADRYEIDRYGAGFATELYGGMPTDRLHLTWPLTAEAVHERLTHPPPPRTRADIADLPMLDLASGAAPPPEGVVPIPADIDALLVRDPDAALAWRLAVRGALVPAFAQGYAVTGFARATVPGNDPVLVLTRVRMPS